MAQNYFGRGATQELVKELKGQNAKRLFLITGKTSYARSGAKEVVDELLKDWTVTRFNNFSPNPTITEAIAASKLCKQAQADTVIAVGGGSAIDLAKTVVAINNRPDQATEIAIGKIPVLTESSMPLIAIPTTAGTGSEATHFAVIYVEGKKYSIASQVLLPTATILDPNLTDSLPPYLTACTGIDALCQAIESLWAIGANDESRSYAKKAIPLILETLPTAVHRPTDRSRETLLQAANLAGQAINISKTTAPHALSYVITSGWQVPHGHAVALTLGAFIEYHNSDRVLMHKEAYSINTFYEINQMIHKILSADSATSATHNWYAFIHKCGLSLNPNQLDFKKSAKQLIQNVNAERLANHPVQITPSSLISILKRIPSTLPM